MWEQVSSEAAGYGHSMGAQRAASEYGSLSEYSQEKAGTAMGAGMQKVHAELSGSSALLESINKDPSTLNEFTNQSKTDTTTSNDDKEKSSNVAQKSTTLAKEDTTTEDIKNAKVANLASSRQSPTSEELKDNLFNAMENYSMVLPKGTDVGFSMTSADGKEKLENHSYSQGKFSADDATIEDYRKNAENALVQYNKSLPKDTAMKFSVTSPENDNVTNTPKVKPETENDNSTAKTLLGAGVATYAAYKFDKSINEGRLVSAIRGNSEEISESQKQSNYDQPNKPSDNKNQDVDNKIHDSNPSDSDDKSVSKKSKFINNAATALSGGFIASALDNIVDGIGVDSNHNRFAFAAKNVAKFSDETGGAVAQVIGGAFKGFGKLFSDNPSGAGDEVMKGINSAGDTLMSAYTSNLLHADEKYAAMNKTESIGTNKNNLELKEDVPQQPLIPSKFEEPNPAWTKPYNPFKLTSGENTQQAIQADQAINTSITSADNLSTLSTLAQSRAGGFMMQNGQMASQFSNAIADSDLSNKDVYNTTNNLLQDMRQQNKTTDMRQRVFNNSSDTNRTMQHKEHLKIITTKEDVLPDD